MKFTYETWINGVKKGEVSVVADSSKKAEKKAIKQVSIAYDITEDKIGLVLIKLEIGV